MIKTKNSLIISEKVVPDTVINDVQISSNIADSRPEPILPVPLDNKKDKIVYNAVELMAIGNDIEQYLIKPIFPKTGTAVLAGKPDIGKSQLARQLCIQIALEKKTFLGFDLKPVYNKAIYLTTEDDDVSTRSAIQKQFLGLKSDAVENLRFIFADTMSQEEIIKVLNKQLKLAPVDLVVIDSFGDIFTGNDGNNNMAMRKTVKTFDKIAKNYNCLILFVHHINKSGYNQAPAQSNIQGGSGLVQKVRLAIQLSEGDGNIRYFSVVKANYCPKEDKQNSLVLNFSEETLLFTNSGEKIATNKLGSQSNIKNDDGKLREFQETAETLLCDNSLSYSDFVIEFCKLTKKSKPTAKRAISKMRELGIIEKIAGNYRLSKGASDFLKAPGDDIDDENMEILE